MKRKHPDQKRCPGKGQCTAANSTSLPINRKSGLSVLSSLLIAILPKCPLCAIAYSSAITMCSGARIYDHHTDWTSFISIGLGLFTVAVVLWNYKGTRTILAAALIIAGVGGLLYAELITGNTTIYYLGSAILISGVWVNGSFMHFFRKGLKALKEKFNWGGEYNEAV